MRKTLDKLNDWANGNLQLTKLSDSDLSNIIVSVTRQIPQIPHIWGDGYADGELVYDMYDCPSCGKSFELYYEQTKCCKECGQRLDWFGIDID